MYRLEAFNQERSLLFAIAYRPVIPGVVEESGYPSGAFASARDDRGWMVHDDSGMDASIN
jgi:hypothetical protein